MKTTRRCPRGICVRDYSIADREALLALWIQVFGETFAYLEEPPPPEDFATHFDRVIAQTHRIWVAVRGEEIAGFLSASSDTVRNLYVATTWQRKGIGTELLETALRECPQLRTVKTLERNIAGRRFYESRGFQLRHLEMDTLSAQPACVYGLDKSRDQLPSSEPDSTMPQA